MAQKVIFWGFREKDAKRCVSWTIKCLILTEPKNKQIDMTKMKRKIETYAIGLMILMTDHLCKMIDFLYSLRKY